MVTVEKGLCVRCGLEEMKSVLEVAKRCVRCMKAEAKELGT